MSTEKYPGSATVLFKSYLVARSPREVAQTGVASGAAVMDNAEAGDVAAVGCKATSLFAIDVGDGFGEPIRPCSAGEYVAASLRADEGVDKG
ncbi:hypothetical protein CGLO_06245 [Colletotrichum gloeosporioides Cg-14]|uniref:Uncharacterized protein n=1 Tax=Colletotrichum gloeosporioides (strain Cg-14) TaxID=1237896 RepID=T0KEY8_COLGC|nr:hypothetical protein CGLO_06245 [Colletotrichum gloeosporioides Cg-14]